MLLEHLGTLHHYGMSSETYSDTGYSRLQPFDKVSLLVAGVWACFVVSELAHLDRCKPVTFEA